MNYSGKIITLWAVFLLGTLFHTQLGLMPLFHGVSVARADVHDTAMGIAIVLWLMLGFFVIPMFTMIGVAFTDNRSFRIGHFWLTILYSVLNFFHVVADLVVQPIVWPQITLMVALFGVGLWLNLASFQWMAVSRRHPPRHTLPTHS